MDLGDLPSGDNTLIDAPLRDTHGAQYNTLQAQPPRYQVVDVDNCCIKEDLRKPTEASQKCEPFRVKASEVSHASPPLPALDKKCRSDDDCLDFFTSGNGFPHHAKRGGPADSSRSTATGFASPEPSGVFTEPASAERIGSCYRPEIVEESSSAWFKQSPQSKGMISPEVPNYWDGLASLISSPAVMRAASGGFDGNFASTNQARLASGSPFRRAAAVSPASGKYNSNQFGHCPASSSASTALWGDAECRDHNSVGEAPWTPPPSRILAPGHAWDLPSSPSRRQQHETHFQAFPPPLPTFSSPQPSQPGSSSADEFATAAIASSAAAACALTSVSATFVSPTSPQEPTVAAQPTGTEATGSKWCELPLPQTMHSDHGRAATVPWSPTLASVSSRSLSPRSAPSPRLIGPLLWSTSKSQCSFPPRSEIPWLGYEESVTAGEEASLEFADADSVAAVGRIAMAQSSGVVPTDVAKFATAAGAAEESGNTESTTVVLETDALATAVQTVTENAQDVSDAVSQSPRTSTSDLCTAAYPTSGAVTTASRFCCALCVDEVALMKEFARCNELLRRHGFQEVRSNLETLPAISDKRSASKGPSGCAQAGGRSRLTADGRGLWAACADVLTAYDERGKRLRDALLAARADGRHTTDQRIERLLRENARLETEVQALRSAAAAAAGGQEAPPSRRLHSSVSQASTRMTTVAAAAATASPSLEHERELTREVAEAGLRVRALEAAGRQKEREVDRLKARLKNLISDAERRQERERAVLARPLRRRGGAASASRTNDPALEAALAHQARADSLEAEVANLTKQAHVLSFQLEESEQRCRRLEALQRVELKNIPSLRLHQPSNCAPTDASAMVSAVASNTVVKTSPSAVLPTSSADEMATELCRLRDEAACERGRRQSAEEHLARQIQVHAEQVSALSSKLREAEARMSELEAERRAAQQLPGASELRWQREALRLRDELGNLRRRWRSADPRALMRRDKQLQSLGLDARALEESVNKADLVAVLLDISQALKLTDISQISALARSARSALAVGSSSSSDCYQKSDIKRGEDDASDREIVRLAHVLAKETDVVTPTARRAEATATANVAATSHEANTVSTQTCHHQRSDEALCSLAAELGLRDDATQVECSRRLAELRVGGVVVDGLVNRLCCSSAEELPRATEALLKVCDERLATQRIVDALQKLLRVDGISQVLPALKDVLDIGALRRRAAMVSTVTSSPTTSGANGSQRGSPETVVGAAGDFGSAFPSRPPPLPFS
eukprot:TRINITY_DN39958_c0_g1_i1.p1 TRINITY_DN39958_c0_g1~~TRINITY_DN39958_c0_g1_i1.p1  ORF type:complete len:1267 (+),score=220.23 TRINITY_DN39958_c0_g1_i1:141-3941(+)